MTKATLRQIGRGILLLGAGATALVLIQAWQDQTVAPINCKTAFGALAEHNGYIQLDLVRQHPTEQYFDGEVFVLYASSESPPDQLRLIRDAAGNYARSVIETKLVPFGDGKSTPKPLDVSLPTPGLSQRFFPFDSPTFDVGLRFEPAQRPKVLIFRNRTADFIPMCETFRSKWEDRGKLTIQLAFRRNPFVQAVVVIVGLAALGFGVLLGQIKDRENLATATASYFFSLWSVRGIVAPSSVSYPTLLDLWLMTVSLLVLFLVAWRLLSPTYGRRQPTA